MEYLLMPYWSRSKPKYRPASYIAKPSNWKIKDHKSKHTCIGGPWDRYKIWLSTYGDGHTMIIQVNHWYGYYKTYSHNEAYWTGLENPNECTAKNVYQFPNRRIRK